MKTRLTGGSARQPAKKTGRPERRKVNTTSERRKEGDIYLLTRKSMSTNKGRTSISSSYTMDGTQAEPRERTDSRSVQ
jgi:hypothetical protein